LAVSVEERTQKLARLAVRVGANVQEGQDVFVLVMDLQHTAMARAVTASAYEAGARFVSVVYWDPHVKLARLQGAPGDSLAFIPDWWDRIVSECIERKGASITIWGDPQPDLFDGVDACRRRPDADDAVDLGDARRRRGQLDGRPGAHPRHGQATAR